MTIGKGLKLAALIILTTLVATTTAALEWESPEQDEVIPDNYLLELQHSSGEENIDITISWSEDNEDWEEITTESTDTEGSVDYEWGDTPTSGEYYLTASEGEETDNQTIQITLDKSDPFLDTESPEDGEYVSDNSPTIEAEFSDDYSDVGHTNITLLEGTTVLGYSDGFSSSQSIDVSDLDNSLEHGTEYTVEYDVNDTVGNEDTGSWSFTVDTSYEGGNLEMDPEGGMFRVEEFGDISLTLEGTGDETSDKTVYCRDDTSDDLIDSDGSESMSEGGEESFSCNVDLSEYGGQTAYIYAEVCDEAGNCGGETTDYQFGFDAAPPTIMDLETTTGHTIFNSNYNVQFEAFDDVSGMEEVEYFFDSETEEGEGNTVEWEPGVIEFEADTSDVRSGNRTLYVRGKDNVGRWSTPEELSFEFYPDEEREIGLNTLENFSLTAGESKDFDVTVENTGVLYIDDIGIQASAGDFFNSSETISGLEPDEALTFSFTVVTEDESIGEHTAKVKSDRPQITKEFPLLVTANEDQRNEISQEVSFYRSEMDEIGQNVSRLEDNGLSEERRDRLGSNVSIFENRITELETAIEEGRYYEANRLLEGIDSDLQTAKQSYEVVKQEHETAQRQRMIMLGLVLVGVLGIGAAALMVYHEDFSIDHEEIFNHEIFHGATSLGAIEAYEPDLGPLREKLNSFLESTDKEERSTGSEDLSWEGFKD